MKENLLYTSKMETKDSSKPNSQEKQTPKFSRREAIKAGAGIGLLSYAGLRALPVLRELGLFVPKREAPPAAPLSPEEVKVIETQMAPALEPTQEAAVTTEPGQTPEPTPTREPVIQTEGEFAGLNFYDNNSQLDMGVFLDNARILIPPVTPLRFYPGVLKGAEFEPYANRCLVWRDASGYLRVEGHSGWYSTDRARTGFTFTPWQLALEERPALGNTKQMVRVAPSVVDKAIIDDYVGRDVVVRQGDKNALLKIAAGVRVPPDKIIASKRNIADIVPWLGKAFPGHGFEDLAPYDPGKILVIKFCGRNLQGEQEDWAKEVSGEESLMRVARFFFALKQP